MKKIKFNWGFGIVIACLIFMTVTVITGITFMSQKVDLVEDNYYEKELKYQDHIDKMNRSLEVNGLVDIRVLPGNISLGFSDSLSIPDVKGTVKFYRPSDSDKDFTLPLNIDAEGNQQISIAGIEKGFWKIQVSWEAAEQEYYTEKSIIIN